jgi:hypothetical protein
VTSSCSLIKTCAPFWGFESLVPRSLTLAPSSLLSSRRLQLFIAILSILNTSCCVGKLQNIILTPQLWTCLELDRKYNLEGSFYFLLTKWSSNPNTKLSYYFEFYGCNITPCPSNTKNDNWVVFCMSGIKCCPNTLFNKPIYLALVKF